jgi:hypothetical protein
MRRSVKAEQARFDFKAPSHLPACTDDADPNWHARCAGRARRRPPEIGRRTTTARRPRPEPEWCRKAWRSTRPAVRQSGKMNRRGCRLWLRKPAVARGMRIKTSRLPPFVESVEESAGDGSPSGLLNRSRVLRRWVRCHHSPPRRHSSKGRAARRYRADRGSSPRDGSNFTGKYHLRGAGSRL